MWAPGGWGRPALFALVAATALPATHAAGQQSDHPAFRVSVFGAGSLRDSPTGFRVARDVISYSVRFTLPRRASFHPWVQAGRFERPELDCRPGIPCNDDGWTVHGGVALPLSVDDTRGGPNVHLLTGLGAAFSAEDRFSYALGFGLSYPVARWAPSGELVWVDLPGIRNVMMLNLGLRVDLF